MATKLKFKAPKKVKAFKDIAKASLAKVKTVTPKKPKMDFPNLSQFTGPKSTAHAQAEGRLKVAAKSKYKAKVKAAVKKAKKKKGGYLNIPTT